MRRLDGTNGIRNIKNIPKAYNNDLFFNSLNLCLNKNKTCWWRDGGKILRSTIPDEGFRCYSTRSEKPAAIEPTVSYLTF